MIWKKGNIWFWHKLGHYVVIPTNAGWKLNGDAIMGTGLAQEASQKHPDLPKLYGIKCRSYEPYSLFLDQRLVLLPTKRLNQKQPFLSWKANSEYDYIKEQLQKLENDVFLIGAAKAEDKKVYVPILGAGSGHLDKKEIIHIMDTILKNDVFIGVET